ncbi:MAG: hypothetical protein AB8G95_06600 [Anaerolineae bacterium]
MTVSAENRPNIKLNWYLIAALVIACVTAWPLISGGGLINTRGGGDSPFLLQRLHQIEQAIFDGHFPVRWMGDANYGYGYPFFNFYAPFAFYIAFIYRLFGVSYVQAIQLSQLTAFLVAGWGAFSLAQRWYRRDWVALAVSAAYTTAPFHLVNVYVRGDSIAEFWAMAFYPLVILAADKLLKSDSSRGRMGVSWLNGVTWLGLAYGGLTLSHNISAMIFSPFVLLFALCRLAPIFLKTNGVKRSTAVRFYAILPKLLLVGTALLLGMALSAWFWLPALGERNLTSIADMTVGYFNYRYKDGLHFRSTDLVQSSIFFNPALEGGQAFRMGLVQALLTGVSLIGLVFWKAVRKRLGWGVWLFMVVGLAVSTFMLTPLSIFLWDILPLLPFTQFPWRFLSVQAFFTAMLSGVPLFALMRLFGRNPSHTSPNVRKRPVWLAPFLSGSMAAVLVVIALGNLNLTYLPVADSDVTGYTLTQYEWFTRNIGTTVSAEYLPPEAHPRPVTSPWLDRDERDKATVLTGSAEATLISRKTDRQEWQVIVAEGEQAIIVFPTLFWDGWNALLDGQIWGGTPARLSGLMQVTVPPGVHEISLVLGRTRIRAIGEFISVSVFVLVIAIFATDTKRWQLSQAFLRGAALPVMALGTVLLAWSLAPAIPENGVYSQDFAQLGWLHPENEILFENGAVLKNVSFIDAEIVSGSPFSMELEWDNVPADVEAELALIIPADNFTTRAFPAAQLSLPLKNGITRYQLDVPLLIPAGLVTPKLTLSDNSRSLTENAETRGELFLEPQLIKATAGETVSDQEQFAELDVSLRAVTHPRPGMLQLDLAWYTARPLAENLVASFRLTDAHGNEIHGAQQDFQPGFGHRPTSAWQANSFTFDVMGMKLPQPLPFEAPYTLLVYLYEPDDLGQVRLFRRLGTLEGPSDQLVFRPNDNDLTIPSAATDIDVPLVLAGREPILALRGYQTEKVEGGLAVTLYWQAQTRPPADYTHFVHLIDPNSGQPAVQHDSMPGNYTWPTSQLVPGQIIEDRVFLPTANLAAGEYRLTTGLYENDGNLFPRLVQASGGNGVIELEKVLINP